MNSRARENMVRCNGCTTPRTCEAHGCAVPTKQERALDLIRQEAARTSKAAVAMRLGLSRTAVSLVLNGKYPAKGDKVFELALAVLDKHRCPYLDADISARDCRAVHSVPTPSHDPAQLAHRRACRGCTHKSRGGLHPPEGGSI